MSQPVVGRKPAADEQPALGQPPATAQLRAGRPLALLDEQDLGWVDALVDVVVRHAGEAWRVALDEIEAGAWMAARARADRGGTSERPHVGDHTTRADGVVSDDHIARADRRLSERPHAGDSHAGNEPARPRADDESVRAHVGMAGPAPITRRSGTTPAREPTPRRINAAVAALRRLLGGRAYHASLARKARALVLGVPALDADARAARLAAAGVVLGLPSREIEQVLWADLPSERPIELRQGRPPAAEVAAHANVGLVQRSLRRAHAVELRVRGDAGPLVRAVAARGLIAVTSIAADGATVFEIAGPLALCHRTSVYGRALGGLVPLLGGCDDFEMQIRAEARGQLYELAVAAPALLPALPAPRPWKLVERLARDLEKRGFQVERAPAPLASPHGIVCPDLRVEFPAPPGEAVAPPLPGEACGAATADATRAREVVDVRSVWLEIVGFWTPEYLARKVARYAAAGIRDVVLCIDGERACDDDDPPAGACVVRFTRRIDADALAQLLGMGG
jgi:predicted nuclease of restriction endonuclease-like RecB superfamily